MGRARLYSSTAKSACNRQKRGQSRASCLGDAPRQGTMHALYTYWTRYNVTDSAVMCRDSLDLRNWIQTSGMAAASPKRRRGWWHGRAGKYDSYCERRVMAGRVHGRPVRSRKRNTRQTAALGGFTKSHYERITCLEQCSKSALAFLPSCITAADRESRIESRSLRRKGNSTTGKVWGLCSAVLVSDQLFSELLVCDIWDEPLRMFFPLFLDPNSKDVGESQLFPRKLCWWLHNFYCTSEQRLGRRWRSSGRHLIESECVR